MEVKASADARGRACGGTAAHGGAHRAFAARSIAWAKDVFRVSRFGRTRETSVGPARA
jgi:hypothetical protein